MKKLFAVFIGLFLISIVSANIIISPNPIDITTNVGTIKSYNITITNQYDFNVLDFTFGNLEELGFTFPEIEIQKNQTKTINFTVTTSTSIHEILSVPISFKFPVDLPNEPTVYYVNITEIGFNPDYTILRQGDTITWTNNDDIQHQIFSTEFDLSVAPNTSVSWLFQNMGVLEYYDPEWYGWGQFEATIEIINQTSEEIAHNPNYDIIWIINLNSILNPTNLTIDNSKDSYEIQYGKFKKGLLTIKNTGNEIAEVVTLSSDLDWVSFNKNDINIAPGEEDWVEYSITPMLLETNQTDKEYTFNLKVKASNSEEYKINITIFVPFKEITSEFGESDIDTLNWLKNVFCPLYPTSFLCNQSTINQGNQSGINQDQTITFNASIRDIFDIKKDISKLKDSSLRSDNQWKIIADKYGMTMPMIMELLNKSLETQEKTEDREQERWNIIWIIGGGVVIIFLLLWGINTYNKKAFKEDLMGGAFQYRK